MISPAQNLLLNVIFAALADATRRRILEQLGAGEATVSQLAEPHSMSLPAVSKHLRVLEDAGLLQRRIEGRVHYLKANPKPMRQAVNWIERQGQFWQGSFDRLDHLLQQPAPSKPTSPP